MNPRCGALSLLSPGQSWASPSARSRNKEIPASHRKSLNGPFPLSFASSHAPGPFPCPENLGVREFKLSGGDLPQLDFSRPESPLMCKKCEVFKLLRPVKTWACPLSRKKKIQFLKLSGDYLRMEKE